MAYSRVVKKIRGGKRGNPRRRRKLQAMRTANKALSIMSKINRAVELKYVDHEETAAGLSYDANVLTSFGLTPMAAGTGVSARSGVSIQLQAMELRFRFVDGNYAQAIRCIVIWDIQNTITTRDALIQLPAVVPTLRLVAPYNTSTRKQFHVLHDKLYNFGTKTGIISRVLRFRGLRRFGESTYDYNDDITRGVLKFFIISNRDPTDPTSRPTSYMRSRVYFTDI